MSRYHLLAVLVLTAGCSDEDPTGPGRIVVTWTGADSGQLQVPALARWCANDSVVEITGAAGDSGVALAMLPPDTTIAAGDFPVGLPIPVRSRPAARVALRWVSETLTEGYYGLHGTVTVDSGSSLSGRVQATLKSVNDGQEISLSGTFTQVRIHPGSAESCGIRTGAPTDTSAD
jgi:hypothetical protein